MWNIVTLDSDADLRRNWLLLTIYCCSNAKKEPEY